MTRYWFGDDEAYVISVYRVLIGLAVTVESSRWLLHLEEIDQILVPMVSMFPFEPDLSNWLMAMCSWSYVLLFISAVLVTVGLFSNIAIIVCCVTYRLHMCYLYPFIDASSMLCFINLLLLCLVDNSRFISIDRRIFSRASSIYRQRLPGNLIKRIMQWHFITVFVSTGLHKATNPGWLNGEAALLVFNSATWSNNTVFTEFLTSHYFVGLVTGILIVFFEIAFIFASLKSMRAYFVAGGIMMHFMIVLLLTVPYGFLLYFIPAYLLLFDSDELRAFLGRVRVLRTGGRSVPRTLT